ncbi:MAG: peptidyl-prolyl cis-trans isomerase, partial [Mariniphaga sp.]|nr:peptidyl-prolyl cis-trans isomerase [Mariniphaga sp.]
MSRISILYILTLLLVAMSCSDSANDSDKPVAKVGDKYLYLSEVYDFVPNKIGVSDSTLMAEDYIKKWIQKELLIKKAEENLSHEQKDVSKEL